MTSWTCGNACHKRLFFPAPPPHHRPGTGLFPGRLGGVSPLLLPARGRPLTARGIQLSAVPRPRPEPHRPCFGLLLRRFAVPTNPDPSSKAVPSRPGTYPLHPHMWPAVSFLVQSSGSLPVGLPTRTSGGRGDFPRYPKARWPLSPSQPKGRLTEAYLFVLFVRLLHLEPCRVDMGSEALQLAERRDNGPDLF